ncbi:alpha-galactosidase [Acidobacteria bacterium AB60]|nr:alpha-galactosidase [Acidobacteria bacterium AB60]
MNRRNFLISSGVAGIGSLIPAAASGQGSGTASIENLSWNPGQLQFQFSLSDGRLRQHAFLPADFQGPQELTQRFGVEVGLLFSGDDSPDSGMKQSGGSSGQRLRFVAKDEQRADGDETLVLRHTDPMSRLNIESHYQGFDNSPVVRRHVVIRNDGDQPVGLEYVSSAMLHGLADPLHYEGELFIWLAYNSWMAEGQWHRFRPSELGFVENMRTSWSQAAAGSIGSWSSEKYLPMAVVENTSLGIAWFWQIEHNGSWHWEISNVAERGIRASNVYAYLGGPDQLHSQAWKNLKPGESFRTVPVAIGCVRGGFENAIQALTRYREQVCVRKRAAQNLNCPVIFNDYMNCLWGDPSEEKELPLIDAAAAAGCEYFVIDAGWYAEENEDWSSTVGLWQPSRTRWPHGIRFVLDRIRQRGMVPGLWLEPEVAGKRSALAQKPDSWFFMRHGQRVIKNSRLLLDFRNPEVRSHLNGVIERLVNEYGVGYIKMDYNTDTLEGTSQNADSFGQGLLEHNRAVLSWLDTLLDRYPKLVIENCGSGGGRMDYGMLSHTQIQSCTDQEEYLRLPAIATGASAGVVPSQLALWSYPRQGADADQASFNMVTAMLLRIHQSGHLAKLDALAVAQVKQGIRIYKEIIREHIPEAVPFYPLGMPDVTNSSKPIAFGIKSPKKSFVALWRLDGEQEVRVPIGEGRPEIVYPTDLGIKIAQSGKDCVATFPRPRMGCILSL